MASTIERPGAITLRGSPLTAIGPKLEPGDQAPDFNVVDANLQPFNLEKTGGGIRVFSVIPSLDTPVCDAQTKRFGDTAKKLANVKFFTISMDLPFAQKRWCDAFGVDDVTMLSDHKNASFGESYGTLIKELRIESRAIFVLDDSGNLTHVEYVKEVGEHPNYEAALAAVQSAQAAQA